MLVEICFSGEVNEGWVAGKDLVAWVDSRNEFQVVIMRPTHFQIYD